ncbi:MAG: repressor LexA [Pseudohongiellaceae bacterium]|jgi:repressor LexA
MNKLTARQEEILAYIKDYLQETGFPPTRSEIATKMGYRSANAAEEHLRALARKGAIEIQPGTSRGIKLPMTEQLGLPIIGLVAAGSPILAEESISEYCNIPPDMFSPRADYLLSVKGTSMIDVGIYEDDLLVVHKTDRANDGDIVVARIDDEVTVKRLKTNAKLKTITLLAENPEFAPIEVDLRTSSFSIEGISVGIIRRNM